MLKASKPFASSPRSRVPAVKGISVFAFALILLHVTASLTLAGPKPTPTLAATPAPEARALFEKAQAAFREKRYKDARNGLLELIGRFPVEDVIPRSKVLLAELEEDFDASLEQLKALAQEYNRKPEGQTALQELAQRYYLADRYDEAAEAYGDYLRRYAGQSDEAEARYWRGSSLLAAGRNDEALDEFEKSLAIDPSGPWAPKSRLARSGIYLKQRRYEDARKELLVVLDRHPLFGEQNQVLLKLGRAYEALGRPKEARAAYRTLLERFPKSMEVTEAKERLVVIEKDFPRLAGTRTQPLLPMPRPTAIVTPMYVSKPEGTATIAPPRAPTPTVVPIRKGPYRVQVGVYSVRRFALKMMGDLKKAGFDPTLTTVKGARPVYKVRTGYYADKEEARRLGRVLQRRFRQKVIVVEE